MLILFGTYNGTCKQGGFRWGNPFYANGPAGQGGGRVAVERGQEERRRVAGAGRPQEAQALQGDPARPHAERRQAQGQRQARQPRRDRRRRRVARGGHREGRVRRRRLRDATSRRRARRRCGTSPARTPTTTGETSPNRGRDHAARQRGRGLGGAARGAHGAARAGGRGRGAGPAHPPGLRAGDRPGDAPPPAGRGRHRRAAQDRHRRGEHGRDGPRRLQEHQTSSTSTRSARPPWSATSWSCSAARAR